MCVEPHCRPPGPPAEVEGAGLSLAPPSSQRLPQSCWPRVLVAGLEARQEADPEDPGQLCVSVLQALPRFPLPAGLITFNTPRHLGLPNPSQLQTEPTVTRNLPCITGTWMPPQTRVQNSPPVLPAPRGSPWPTLPPWTPGKAREQGVIEASSLPLPRRLTNHRVIYFIINSTNMY